MTARFSLPILSLVLATLALGGAASAQSVNDYSLPPAPTPTASPKVQGPVATEGAVPLRPRAIPTATPTPQTQPTLPPPLPTPGPSPLASSQPAQTPTSRPQASSPTASATPRTGAQRNPASRQPPRPAPAPGAEVSPTAPAPSAATPTPASPVSTFAPAPQPSTAQPAPASNGWIFWLLGLVALAAAGGAFLALRRRREDAEPAPIEPPLARPREVEPTAEVAPAQALALQVEALRLNRSFLNLTVDYRITLRNRLSRSIENASVEADLVSASNDLPLDRQLATQDTALPARHAAARLGPGQSQRFEGKLQLPIAKASIIRQGGIGLLVPLLRARASAGNAEPLARTYVIGQGAPGASRPQPLRVDEPPRSYEPLIQRALD